MRIVQDGRHELITKCFKPSPKSKPLEKLWQAMSKYGKDICWIIWPVLTRRDLIIRNFDRF